MLAPETDTRARKIEREFARNVRVVGPEGGDLWLPESYHLHLTALEAGALMAIVSDPRLKSMDEFRVRVRGRDEDVPIRERLLEKMELARRAMDTRE